MKKLLIILLLACVSCSPEYVDLEVTYTTGEKEFITTELHQNGGCDSNYLLKEGCLRCVSQLRCGVRSVKVLKKYTKDE